MQSMNTSENTGQSHNSRPLSSHSTAQMSDRSKRNNSHVGFPYETTLTGRMRADPWGAPNGAWDRGLSSTSATSTAAKNDDRLRESLQQAPKYEFGFLSGVTGSASLVESSTYDATTLGRAPFNLQSTTPSHPGRTLSHVTPPELPISQRGSFSSASSATVLGHPSSLFSAFGQNTRPAPVHLNAPPASQTRGGLGSNFSSAVTSRDCESQPPQVYTKYDRPTDPSQQQSPELTTGKWPSVSVAPSPNDERDHQRFPSYARNASVPALRENTLALPQFVDEQPAFNPVDYNRSSRHITPASSRTPSISSRHGPYGGALGENADSVHLQFRNLHVNPDSRPSTSYISAGGHSSQPSAVSNVSSFTRPTLQTPGSERSRFDMWSESDRPGTGHRRNDSYGSMASPNQYPPYRTHDDYGRLGESDRSTGRPREGHNSVSSTHRTYSSPRQFSHVVQSSFYNNPRSPQPPLATQISAPPPFHQFGYPGTLPMVPSPYMGLMPYNLDPTTGPAPVSREDMDPVLADFKSGNSRPSKAWELRHIYGHITAFTGDQHGSRFIQTKLETANSDEKERVYNELEPNALQHMFDVFGNYVIQKFFEHGDQRHKRQLANKMKGQVLTLSLQMYGCRVVQKALDHILVDQQASLITELENHVVVCVKDQNGNHVIQKAIQRCPPESILFIVNALLGQVRDLSAHTYGCRVIQRCLEQCDLKLKARIMNELMGDLHALICDQFGNYVIQHIVTHDAGPHQRRVLDAVLERLGTYSKHKYASNVVEKCLQHGDDSWRSRVLAHLTNASHSLNGEDVMVGLIKDQYGNYVIQKLLGTLKGTDYYSFADILPPALHAARRCGCNKQVQAIEKTMRASLEAHQRALAMPSLTADHIPSPTTPTPALTADTQSLQSSRIPSVDGDTVEGAPVGRSGTEFSKLDSLI